MSLLDGLIGSGNGSVTVKTDGVELPKRAKVNFTSDGSIDVDGADATDTSNVTLKHGTAGGGNQHSTAIATGSVGAQHGFMHADTKRDHDRMYRQGVWAPAPSGDTTGATDTAALQAAIDLARTQNVPCYLWPGTYYTNATLLISGGATTAGGFALIGAHGYATKIVDTSDAAARVAGSCMIGANDNCVLARFEDLWLVPNRVEKVFDVRLSSAQTHTNRFHRLRVFGPDYIPATSATSLDTSIASKTVTYGSVTNHFDGAPPRFDVGTKIWLGSRGSGAIMMGTITSWNGTNQFQFTPDVTDFAEVWDTDGTVCGPGASGSHTDWDIRFPITGFDLTGSANTELDFIFTDGLYTEVNADATYNVRIGKNVINNNRTFGPRFRAASIAQGLKIEANFEPGIFGWHFYIALGAVFNATIHPGTGDGGVRGPLIYLKDSLNVTISEGTLSKDGSADNTAWIRAENTEGLTVRDIMVYGVTSGGREVVEVIGFALNPRIDVRRVPNAELMRNRSLATGWITTGLDGMQTQAYGTIYNFFTRYHQVDGYVPPAAGYLSLFRGDAYDPATMAWGAYSGTGFGTAQVGLHADVPHASFVSLPATTTAGFCPLGRDSSATYGLSPLFVATPSFFKFYTPGVGASKPITVVAGNHIDFGAAKLRNLTDPSSAQDAATKASSEAAATAAASSASATALASAQAYADAYAHPDLLTISASNVDWSTGPTKTKTLAANTTWTFTSPGAWCATLVQEIVQNGTGGFTSTLPASVVNKAAIEAVLNANTLANTRCVVTYFWNKTDYVGAILVAGV